MRQPDHIEIHYEQMRQLIDHFLDEADEISTVIQRLEQDVYALQAGGWTGPDAAIFIQEVRNDLLPALIRLRAALREGGEITESVERIFNQSEVNAHYLFRRK